MSILQHPDKFVNRHLGPNDDETQEMIKVIGLEKIDKLISETIPPQIRFEKKLQLDNSLSETEFLTHLKSIASKNKIFKSYIGMGYNPTILPKVIQRNILENPGWYTQYTPYQAEIAQGRLEALLNFQTLIIDLTGLPVANASLLDEATAAAEAMSMLYNQRTNKNANTFLVSSDSFPQTIDVLKTRSAPLGIQVVVSDVNKNNLTEDVFGLFVQYPSDSGVVTDFKELFSFAKEKKIFKVVAADLLSLALLTPPGEFGADVVVGTSQRFGVPMGYGGPHAAYFATTEDFKRYLPGRIIGISMDHHGNPAFRMALQTREQHIRREKATSNICTAQVLLAIMAGMYAVYHGPKGIKAIAEKTHLLTRFLDHSLTKLGYKQVNKEYFDTLKISFNSESSNLINEIKSLSIKNEMNFRYIDDFNIGITFNECTEVSDVTDITKIFAHAAGKEINEEQLLNEFASLKINLPSAFLRTSKFLTHPVFNSYQSETEMMRYIKRLENKDLSLVHSMIPLGSCTMKLNAATEMMGITWAEFSNLHPFVPVEQAEGYHQLFKELEKSLAEITGFDSVSLQPNAGAQGEYTGLLVIREYHIDNGDSHRNVVLIPSSAHGTNPASAVMAGMKVVVVNCDKFGNVSLDDLKIKAEQNKDNLAALMITYPSTHGVFEHKIVEICDIVHDNGGLVYMDGANLNAQVGLTSPGFIGADVCHLNLHKTFCIPHGGGGPGMGPIAVSAQLTKYLPGHAVVNINKSKSISAVSAAPWGSANILIISYAYIKMMGAEGLEKASVTAILNANYIKAKLETYYDVLYAAKSGHVAHELIFDMRKFKTSANIEVEDIAKRLMDYGYHAPTVSFPVPGTLMIEPTESESKAELDKFCSAMIKIREEIAEIESGVCDNHDNVLKNAPHTIQTLLTDEWKHSYSREKAAYPLPWTKVNKFWPSVGRVNNAHGDRNLICSCNPITDYAEEMIS